MKKIILSIIIVFTFSIKIFAQVPDSTQTSVIASPNIVLTDTTADDDETEFESTEERDKLPNWFYTVSLDGTASSGNVNRQLLNFKTTLNYENKKSIFGFFTSPRFQYGTNSDVLQEREIGLDINSTLFYSQHDVYGLLFGAFEQSNIRKISSRFNIGIGIGWRIFGGKKNPNARFKLSISNALVREITDFIIKQDRNVYRNSTRIRLKYDIIPDKFFFQSVVFLQPSLIDEYYRWNSSTQLSYKVGKHISILASFENTYENFNTIGIQNAQTNTTIGLTYSGSK